MTDAFTGMTFKTWIFLITLSRHLHSQIVTDQKVGRLRVSPLSRQKSGLYMVHGVSLHGF